jgi:hypothetical protein
MKLTRPKPQNPARVYLVANDADGNLPSKSLTIYDATPEEVIAIVAEAIAARASQSGEGANGKNARNRKRASSAA